MKFAAHILSLLMLCMMAQPLLIECQAKSIKAAAKTHCGKSCHKKKTEPAGERKSCNSDKNKECDRTSSCNPFAACSQCQYMASSKYDCSNSMVVVKKDQRPAPGDTLSPGFGNNCWQPPEWVV